MTQRAARAARTEAVIPLFVDERDGDLAIVDERGPSLVLFLPNLSESLAQPLSHSNSRGALTRLVGQSLGESATSLPDRIRGEHLRLSNLAHFAFAQSLLHPLISSLVVRKKSID